MTRAQIINELNDLLRELDDVGETIIDCVVDSREDNDLPPLTPEEYSAAAAECAANAEKAEAIWDRIHGLQDEYDNLVGEYPIYCDGAIPSFRDRFSWERL